MTDAALDTLDLIDRLSFAVIAMAVRGSAFPSEQKGALAALCDDLIDKLAALEDETYDAYKSAPPDPDTADADAKPEAAP